MHLAAVLAPLLAATPALAGPQIPQPETTLLVPAPLVEGTAVLGLRIDVPDGWHTYWRNPGDAGVPPLLTTDGSRNLASAVMAFPAPERAFDGFSTSIVYHDAVVLPLTVTAADPDQPVDLVLRLDFGYCKEICVPASADLVARLTGATPADPQAAAAVEAALAAVPVPEADAPADAPRIAGLKVADGVLLVDVSVPPGAPDVDLFSEPPEGWYLSQPSFVERTGSQARFRLPLKGRPKGADTAGATFRFTIVGGAVAVEAVRQLP